ncbi:MAG: hypothetical protein WCH52_08845 [Bacteroidota bacterium]
MEIIKNKIYSKFSCHFKATRAIFLRVIFIAFLSSIINYTDAQCSTVLNGTYTVGGTGDFVTLTAAANAYNNSCLTGNVIFILINSNYSTSETFPIIFKQHANSGPGTTLKIKPGTGINAVVSGSVSKGALIRILGDYISIDGSNNNTSTKNLSITNTNSNEPRVILFGSVGNHAVTNCGIKNTILKNSICDRSVIIVSDSTMNNPPNAGFFSNINIENNSLKNSIYGIYCRGISASLNGSGLNIVSNDLAPTGASDSILFCGIFLEGVDGALVKGNEIANLKRLDSSSDKGIFISTNVKNTKIINNRIFNLNYTGNGGFGAHGIYVSTGITNANIEISSNMITNISGDGNNYISPEFTLENPAGILLNSQTIQSGIKIYHNSINLGSVTGFTNTLNKEGAISTCIRLRSGSFADIRNNILVNNLGLKSTNGFAAIGIMASTNAAQFDQLNFNDYSVSPTGIGSKLIGFVYNTDNRSSTLSSWKASTGKDLNSVCIVPQFISPTDLHLSTSANNDLNNLGTPLTDSQNDIDNATRNLTKPDIGCDEYIPDHTANWIGKYSGDWDYPENWEANLVANETTDLKLIEGYPNFPIVNSLCKVRNLYLSGLSNGVIITLDTNAVFQVYGSITKSSGFIDGRKGSFGCYGNVAQVIPDSIFQNNRLLNLIIGNNSTSGVSLGGPLDIYRSLSFSVEGIKLNTNDKLTFKSTATETAWIGNLTGKTIIGNVSVERFIPSGISHTKSWQFVSVPLSGNQTINQAWQDTAVLLNQNRYPGYGTIITSNNGGSTSGATSLGFDIYTPAGGTMKTYSSTDSSWIGVPSAFVPIANKKGYFVFVRGDRSVTTSTATSVPTVLRAKGKLYTASAGELPPSSIISANKFESIGNPFASAIDFRYITRRLDGSIDNSFYVWDPLLAGTNNLGGYQTISSVNGYRPIPGGTANYSGLIPCTKIQSGQAFFMHSTGVNSGGAVSFSEEAKIAGTQNAFRNEDFNTTSQSLQAFLFTASGINNRLADGNFIAFDSAYTNDYNSEDALKIMNSGENFGIKLNNNIVSLESRKSPVINDTIFYTVGNLKKQAYQLRLIAFNLNPVNTMPFLVDRYTHNEFMLVHNDTSYFNFVVNDELSSSAADRFFVMFKPMNALPVDFVNVNAVNLKLHTNKIIWQVAQQKNIISYDIERSINGLNFNLIKSITNNQPFIEAVTYQYLDDCAFENNNYYRIKAIELGGNIIYSKIVNVKTQPDESLFSVYPNPVTEKTIHLFYKAKTINPKRFNCKLINTNGQVLLNENLIFSDQNNEIKIKLNDNIASGIYKLLLCSDAEIITIQQLLIK